MPGAMAIFCNLSGKNNRIIEMLAWLYWVNEEVTAANNMKYLVICADYHMIPCYLGLLLKLKLFLPNIMSKHH